MSVLKLDQVSYAYENGGPCVLKDISFEFEKGKMYSIVGRSGTGKTTLLSLLSGLAVPTKGTIYLEDKNIDQIDKYEYRSHYVGVIFQSFNLLPKLTAVENVILSMEIAGKHYTGGNKEARAMELLKKMGLSEDESRRRVLKLSGGQQQRVAIARALSYEPEIIFADEPTGNLDRETQKEIIDIFRRLAHEEQKCVILVTHSPEVSRESDEVFKLGTGVV